MKTHTDRKVFSVGARLGKLLAFLGLAVSFFSNPLHAYTSAIQSVTPSATLRTDWNEYVGFRFTTGSTPLVVQQLGRYIASTHSQTHNVHIVDPNNGFAVVASKDVHANLGTVGTFYYENLSTPVTLQPNHTYLLLSREYSGGDNWYQADTTLTTTGDITIDNPEYVVPANGLYYTNNDFGAANHSYGPASFTYTLGTTGTVAGRTVEAITGASLGSERNNFTGYVGFKFLTGNKGLRVTELGRWVGSTHAQNHTVKIVDAASTTTPVVSATILSSGAVAGTYQYTPISPFTLSANHAYYLLSQETSGGDNWYDSNTGLIPTAELTVTNPEYYDSVYHDDYSNEATNHSYGPANFRYDLPPLVTAVTPGATGLRNDWGNYVGVKFITGSTPLIVTHLGRWKVSSNNLTHAMKIVDPAASNAVVATATVDLASGSSGAFCYAALDRSVTLAASHTYYLLSLESTSSGSDTWYAGSCGISPTGDVTVVAPEFEDSGAYYTDGSPGDQGNHSYGPVSLLYTTARPGWVFQTDDTILNLKIYGAPVVTQLTLNSTRGWDWMKSPGVVALPRRVSYGGNYYVPNWILSSSSASTTSGLAVTLTYTNASPALTLTQVWSAKSGVGPVEQTTSITNSAGAPVSYDDADIIATDFTVNADDATTMWRFSRSSVYDGSDSGFTTGVFKHVLGTNEDITSTVSNDWATSNFVLPYLMLDVSSSYHGLYMGYDCSFGKFRSLTGADPDRIRTYFQLWDNYNFSQATGTTLKLPSMFYGTYAGDTDDGSNKMKKWFWTNKMTPTIISTTNEPLVTVTAQCATEGLTNIFFSDYPSLHSYGVELIKEDKDWASDGGNTSGPDIYGWEWNAQHNGPAPYYDYWPNGFTLPTLVHNQTLKLELYMANTYLGANLATTAGVNSEKIALERRFLGDSVSSTYGEQDFKTNGGTGFDYWRTDVTFEAKYDYLSHLGFTQVVDYMITNYAADGFRWENCSGGGSKKSFDLLRRQTTGCAEDSGLNSGAMESFRMTFYANSYMINPVQLQCQNVEFTEDSTAWGKYMTRTGMMAAWMHLLDRHYRPPGAASDGTYQDALYLNAVNTYVTYQRPILRGANVYHIMPMPDRYNWDGIEYFNPNVLPYGKGSVLLFKPNSGSSYVNSGTIYLKGLNPSKHYTLSFEDRTTLNTTYVNVTGASLMTGGSGISSLTGSSSDYDSEMIWIVQND